MLAQHAFDQIEEVSHVILVPNGKAPHKKNQVSPYHRLQMCKLASKDCEYLGVEEYECKKESAAYTLETIRYIKEKRGAEELLWNQ